MIDNVQVKMVQSYHNISKNAIKSQQAAYNAAGNYVQSYHNISKNAIKSQPFNPHRIYCFSAKLPQYFKECNQVTTDE